MALTQVQSGMISGVSGSSITGSQSIPKAALPAGSVLQVVQATYSTNVSITTQTWTSTGLTASITPTSATSKIYVMVSNPMRRSNAAGVSYGMGIKLYRNSTAVYTPMTNMGYSYPLTDFAESWMVNFNYLDSPATTSSTSYTMYFASALAGVLVGSCVDDNTATIILMEIAA